eukprot:COSAG02_NODE_1292_length_13424_cov_31.074597_5_plen_44_part_00
MYITLGTAVYGIFPTSFLGLSEAPYHVFSLRTAESGWRIDGST